MDPVTIAPSIRDFETRYARRERGSSARVLHPLPYHLLAYRKLFKNHIGHACKNL